MEIKNSGKMLGLFSSLFYSKGNAVLKITGKIIDHPLRTSIQIAPNKHIDVAAPAKFINHSCCPNTKIEGDEIIAVKEIFPGDEVTFDYQAGEYELSHPFICRECGQWVKGMKYKGENVCLPRIDRKIVETQ